MELLVALDSVSHRYASGVEIPFPSFSLEGGQSMMVLGKSGVGKTTLLHIVSGLLPPTDGVVRIIGQDLYQLSGSRLDKFRGQNIGIVFQRPHFFSSLSAIENLQLSSSFQKIKPSDKYIKSTLDRLQILDKVDAKVNELSQGQLQRLSIARACINRPRLILADEPTAALDDDNASSVMSLLREMQQEVGAALMIVTHDHRIQSQVDRVVNLSSTSQSASA